MIKTAQLKLLVKNYVISAAATIMLVALLLLMLIGFIDRSNEENNF